MGELDRLDPPTPQLTPAELDPRIPLAAERTLLAWIRTGLAMMGFGFVVARFGLFLRELEGMHPQPEGAAHPFGLSLWFGVVLTVLGVAVTVLAAFTHMRLLDRLSRREPYQPGRWSLGVMVAFFLATLGLGMTVYLIVVSR